ncbi:Selenocysteine lyase/Cysteine desulfurase [Micromonospora rhizosphaerae]|uniref:Selenocysteine lyase/Cysteine desulfurase n=1 Tax=Micromonospora rhizosphaerae TaxID=568872 RepID=A0A1C6T3Q5_9ACTN|nr:aminotransferase class V-fold PLP-dependent enzyme [Micromonospora rhizosphaerae]SCL36408.1 Selenocysteine lyase/Cysteine desulfurase [Micromonospora rhizosphaerae]
MSAPLATEPDTLGEFRQLFPALSELVHLASCSQGALSMQVTAALFEMQHTMRQHGAPWDLWTREVERARHLFARFINAAPCEIAVVSCASEGAYHVASSRSWERRPKIVTTDMEFPSIAQVWLAQQPRGAEIAHVPHREGIVAAEDYVDAIDEQTGLVSIPLVSYRNGARMPVDEAVSAARRAGAKVFVDGYQACGVLPVDVKAIDCDYLVTGSLKYLLGLPGIAFLYVRDTVAHECMPQLTGWFGQADPFRFDPRDLDFALDARRFQTGTPSIPSAYAAAAGLTVLSSTSSNAVDEKVRSLVDTTQARLVSDGERLWSPADPSLRGPMVALVDENPDDLAAFLAQRRISTSPRGAVLRLSFHGYNCESDVDAVCEAIREYRRLRS